MPRHESKLPGWALRANSRLHIVLGEYGSEFLEHALGAVQRLLPHVEIVQWKQIPWEKQESVWGNSKRQEIRVTIPVGSHGDVNSASLTATVRRRRVAVGKQAAGATLDTREFDICKRIATRISEVVGGTPSTISGATMRAIRDSFDEDIISQHIETHYGLRMSITTMFADLHALSEQSYENKALAFGCIIDSENQDGSYSANFPRQFLTAKKYKALSDGFRTAYYVSGDGRLLDFVDLETFESRELTGHNYYPVWAERLARNSRGGGTESTLAVKVTFLCLMVELSDLPIETAVGSIGITTTFSISYETVRWSRLSEQLFRVDKWSVCRG